MKKIISLTLLLLVVLGSLVVLPASAESKITRNGDWEYKIMDDGNLRIYRYYGDESDITVPDYIDGYKVTKILSVGYKATVVRIGKFVEKIVPNSLSDSDNPIKRIIVSKANKKYSSKSGMLLNKKGNKLVVYPGGLSSSKLKLPKTVVYIGAFACSNNKHFKNLVIPKHIKRIGNEAFAGNKSLEAVKVPKTVKFVGNYAFADCTKLNSITFEKGSKIKSGYSVFNHCMALKEVTLPYIIETKENQSGIFEGCRRLKKVIIPDGIRFIPTTCFEYCPKLKSVTIPSSVTKIGDYAFGYIMGDYVPKFNKDFVIKGVKNSAAHKYAKKNGLKFKEIN